VIAVGADIIAEGFLVGAIDKLRPAIGAERPDGLPVKSDSISPGRATRVLGADELLVVDFFI
jgi:hypothetical protein